MWLKNYFYFLFVCITVFTVTHCSASEECKENCTKPNDEDRPFKLTVIILTMNRPHSLARKVRFNSIFKIVVLFLLLLAKAKTMHEAENFGKNEVISPI